MGIVYVQHSGVISRLSASVKSSEKVESVSLCLVTAMYSQFDHMTGVA